MRLKRVAKSLVHIFEIVLLIIVLKCSYEIRNSNSVTDTKKLERSSVTNQ